MLSQNEDNIWLFGRSIRDVVDPIIKADTTLGASQLDFNYDPVKIYYVPERVIDFSGANASICDSNGNLLAYSNGQVLNAGNEKPIADTINYHIYPNPFEQENCSAWEYNNQGNDTFPIPAGILGMQNVMILPMDEKYYCFYTTYDYCTNEVFKLSFTSFSNKNSSEFKVDIKDSVIINGLFADRIYSIRHANGRDWWVLQLENNNIRVHQFILSPEGLKYIGRRNVTSSAFHDDNGQITVSPDGKKLVISSLGGTLSAPQARVAVLDFNRCTGLAGNKKEKHYEKINSLGGTGATFSPDGKYLYVSEGIYIFQYDMTVSDIFSSEDTIAVFDGFFYQPTPNSIKYRTLFHFMQVAPDGRIYINSSATTNRHLGVINYPHERGVNSGVGQHAIQIPTEYFRTMPNFPLFRLGPDDGSPCDTLGLDNHPVAKFRYEPDSSNYKRIRFTDLSYFRPETWSWDFGDGSPTVTNRYPFHTYTQNGTYEVCLTVSNENSSHTTCQTVTIGTSSGDDAGQKADITLFPNPVADILLVTLGEYIPQHGMIHIHDATGRVILSQRLYYGHNNLDLTGLSPGLYFWTAEDKGVKIKAGKVVKI
jgi:PKD repeat protein